MTVTITIEELTKIRDLLRMAARAERARERPDTHLISECDRIIGALSTRWEGMFNGTH